MIILAIETSCDDTAIAIVEVNKFGNKTKFKILGNEVSSQIDIHKEFGGVFPALAKREHIKNLPIIFENILKKSKVKIEKISAIAVTVGPGLEPALWTGIVFAKNLSKKYKIPIIPVNHMEGHVFSIFPKKTKIFTVNLKEKIFPVLSLLVSGGHTELVLIKNWFKYKKIGQTRDDAVGEAFDKVARMLGLPYPGGPEIGRLAEIERRDSILGGLGSATARLARAGTAEGARGIFQQKNIRASQSTISSDIVLPRPMINSKDYDFSFSGLKTAVLYLIRDIGKLNDKLKRKIAKEFEDAVVEVLVHKTIKAIKEYKIKTLIVGGGVSANFQLKKVISEEIKKQKLKTKIYFPPADLTGDNALMIAIAGYFQYKKGKVIKNHKNLKANGNLSL